MQIKTEKEISPKISDHLFRWREQVFPIEGKGITWAQSEWHLLAYEDDENPVAHIGYGGFTVCIDGEDETEVIGVGGVVVRPEHQGRNIPAQLFTHLHASIQAVSISDLFILFCPMRLQGYYEKHGYKKFTGNFSFMQDGKETTTDKFVLMFYGQNITANNITLNGEPW